MHISLGWNRRILFITLVIKRYGVSGVLYLVFCSDFIIVLLLFYIWGNSSIHHLIIHFIHRKTKAKKSINSKIRREKTNRYVNQAPEGSRISKKEEAPEWSRNPIFYCIKSYSLVFPHYPALCSTFLQSQLISLSLQFFSCESR